MANGDDRKVAIGKLDAEFNITTGHDHDGVNSKQVSAADLADFNNYMASRQTFLVSPGVGTSNDVSVQLTGKTPGGDSVTAGVITTAPYNKVEIRDASTLTYIEDAQGQRVYGRITEALSVYTLTYYTNESGVETAHSLTSTNIIVFYTEVFTMGTRPTINEDAGFLPSLDVTADVVDASLTQRGVVSTGTQSFAGLKTFDDGIIINDYLATPKLDQASGGTITALTYAPLIKITGASTTTIQGIASGADGKKIIIHNASSGTLTIANEDAGATASNRLTLPGGLNLLIQTDKSAEFFYDSTSSRWRQVSSIAAPGGSDTEVQFNDSGVFNGDADFTFDKTNLILTIDKLKYDPTYVPTFWGSAAPSLVGDSTQIPSADTLVVGTTDITSGAASATTANLTIITGDNDNTGTPSGNTGGVYLYSGYQQNNASTGESGYLIASTGDSYGSGNSGATSVSTGDTLTSDTGDLSVSSGNSFTSGDTGAVTLASGASTGGASGNISIKTGVASTTRGFVEVGGGLAIKSAAQTVTAGFTVNADESYIQINAAGILTSSATTAIQTGRSVGQVIVIHNISAFDLTIKNAGNTVIANGADYVLGTSKMITFIWIGSNWLQHSESLIATSGGGSGTSGYEWTVGSAAQVTSGDATHSTWASAIAAASSGDSIKILKGAWTENVSVNKQLNITGNGYGSNLTGSITFTSAAARSHLHNVRASDDITLDAGANLIKVDAVWLAATKTFIDNGTGNLLEAFVE